MKNLRIKVKKILTIIDVVEATVKSKSKEVVLPSVVSDCFLNIPVMGACPIYAIN